MSKDWEWYSFPFKDSKRRIKFLALFIGSVFVFGFAFGFWWGLFSFIVIGLTLMPFYTKTFYKVSDGKIYIKKPLYSFSKELSYYKRVELDKFGIFLSPFKKRSGLDNFRGIFLQVEDEDLKKELYDFFKKEVESDGQRGDRAELKEDN